MGPAVRTSAPIQRGTVVYDVADPRRHGIVNSLNLRDGRFVAKVRWIDTGRKGHWMPVADLRRVTADTSSQPVRGRRLSKPEYGSYDGRNDSSDPSRWPIRYGHHKDGTPCRFRDAEVWEFYSGEWHEIMPSELVYNIGV